MSSLRDEIPGLIESLIDENKHLQAAICAVVFKMNDVFRPDFLFEAHLEYIRNRAAEMVKEGSAIAQNDAINRKLRAIKDVEKCVYDFKLESIYPRASLKLHITQLENEVKEMESTREDPQHKKKRKSSPETSLTQNKHARSSSREPNVPRTRSSSRGQNNAHRTPERNIHSPPCHHIHSPPYSTMKVGNDYLHMGVIIPPLPPYSTLNHHKTPPFPPNLLYFTLV